MASPPADYAVAHNNQSPEKIRGMFRAITPCYDRLNRLFSGRLDCYWRNITAREVLKDLSPCRLIADIATGTGDMADALCREAGRTGRSKPRIYGSDFTHEMVQKAGKKFPAENFHWIDGDGMHLPFPDNTFDALTVGFGLRNMSDKKTALQEMTRVLRPDGKLAILEFGHPSNPVIRTLYDIYSCQFLPRIGSLISGTDAYLYLAKSIQGFWNETMLAEQMAESGIEDVYYRRLMMGVVFIHIGRKG
jgi:demethylmenaquinone methyltransferase/2-methoxy-6-polyprenyl-1,4-benzoquinol methylase